MLTTITNEESNSVHEMYSGDEQPDSVLCAYKTMNLPNDEQRKENQSMQSSCNSSIRKEFSSWSALALVH